MKTYKTVLEKPEHATCVLYFGENQEEALKAFSYGQKVIRSAMPYTTAKGWSIKTVLMETVKVEKETVLNYSSVD